jgi:hypothetical protein
MASHAQRRAQERYGIDGPLPFDVILDTIREGKATKVFNSEGETYDVPLDCPVYTGILRVIVRPTFDWVITVVPPKTPRERTKVKRHAAMKKHAEKRRQLHRELRRENANEDAAEAN